MANCNSPASSTSHLSDDTLVKPSRVATTPSLVPATRHDAVRVIGMHEVRAAGLALAYAFATDAVCRYVVADDTPNTPRGRASGPSPDTLWQLHVDTMTYIVAAVCRRGVVTTIGPDYEGVALWMPPGTEFDGWWASLCSGLWRLRFRLPAEGRRRYYDEVLPLLNRTKAEVMAQRGPRDDSFYLVYLGTKPSARGRGYAHKLLSHMLARADAARRPVYLESSCLANNPYYQRFGFAWQRDVVLVRGGEPIVMSIMVREPRSPRQHVDPVFAGCSYDTMAARLSVQSMLV